MPKFTSSDEFIKLPGAGNFQFSAVRIDELGASEYTLATVIVDASGSVHAFANQLILTVKSIVEACRKSPRAENLLLRVLYFNNQIYEVHGFKNLSEIELDNYDDFTPTGMTCLFDATYDGIGATLEYSKRLVNQDFDCNGCVYIITDGMDNRSSMGPANIASSVDQALANEEIESINTILIGLHDPSLNWEHEVKRALEVFKEKAQLTEFIDVGEATPKQLAKLQNWISQSISSQSQALGQGSPSQVLTF
jgi:uncharacterized protein YegL